ncbi:MAG: hypothetical protein M0R32_05785 [Candidatus Cloacimonetes bacterium]|jgi:hypothetical protein|nr:hypothetical protein [Candidatus Cloacimonadota bacterium]
MGESAKAEWEVSFTGGDKTRKAIKEWIQKANEGQLENQDTEFDIKVVKGGKKSSLFFDVRSNRMCNFDQQVERIETFLKSLPEVQSYLSTDINGEGGAYFNRADD